MLTRHAPEDALRTGVVTAEPSCSPPQLQRRRATPLHRRWPSAGFRREPVIFFQGFVVALSEPEAEWLGIRFSLSRHSPAY